MDGYSFHMFRKQIRILSEDCRLQSGTHMLPDLPYEDM